MGVFAREEEVLVVALDRDFIGFRCDHDFDRRVGYRPIYLYAVLTNFVGKAGPRQARPVSVGNEQSDSRHIRFLPR
jgi:hypothetical protein